MKDHDKTNNYVDWLAKLDSEAATRYVLNAIDTYADSPSAAKADLRRQVRALLSEQMKANDEKHDHQA